MFHRFSCGESMSHVLCATSTRNGGASSFPYHTLNAAYHVGDDPVSVAENRQRLCRALGVDIDSLVLAQQMHGDNIEIIEDTHIGRGAYSHADAIPAADAMVTKSRHATIGVLTADCVPVMIFDPVSEAIGIAHAGWKGALSMIAAKTVLKMSDAFGTKPDDCMVTLGPSIGSCCYEVSVDILSQFRDAFGSATCAGENKLDLPKAVEIQLMDAGVKKVSHSGFCTACNLSLFYSHRAEKGLTGRMMSVIRLIDQ